MKIILDYYVYGMDREPNMKEQEIIDNLYNSEKLLGLVQDIVKAHADGEANPRKYFKTNAPVYDFTTSYTLWRNQSNLTLGTEVNLKTMKNKTVVNNFKGKYFTLSTQTGLSI